MPILAFIEHGWRRLMHQRASIPQAAVALSHELRRADYDFQHFWTCARECSGGYAALIATTDFQADPVSPSHRWARLSAILWQLEHIESDTAAEEHVDLGFVERRRSELDALRYIYRQLAERITSAAAQGGAPSDFSKEIDSLLKRASIFLACALNARHRSRKQLAAAMLALGFTPSTEPEPSNDIDIVVQGFFYALSACFLLIFFAPYLDLGLPQELILGWPAQQTTDAFIWTFSLLLMHGSAIYSALAFRRYLHGRELWFKGTDKSSQMPGAMKYLAVTILSYVVAFVLMSYWDGVVRGAEVILRDLTTRYPLALVPAASAFFVCKFFDHAHVQDSRLRLWSWVAAQVFVTALLGMIGSMCLYEGFDPTPWGAVAFTSFSAGFFALVLGASMAELLAYARQPRIPPSSRKLPSLR